MRFLQFTGQSRSKLSRDSLKKMEKYIDLTLASDVPVVSLLVSTSRLVSLTEYVFIRKLRVTLMNSVD